MIEIARVRRAPVTVSCALIAASATLAALALANTYKPVVRVVFGGEMQAEAKVATLTGCQ